MAADGIVPAGDAAANSGRWAGFPRFSGENSRKFAITMVIAATFFVGAFGLARVWPTTIAETGVWAELTGALENLNTARTEKSAADEGLKASPEDPEKIAEAKKSAEALSAAESALRALQIRMSSVEMSRTIGIFGAPDHFLNRSVDLRMMAIVVFAALIGSAIHAARGLALHVANGTYAGEWMLWYFFRPAVGSGLALIAFFTLRGFVTPSMQLGQVAHNAFGFAMIGALTGMFSGQASKRLEKTFEALFGDQEKPDVKPAAGIASVSKVNAGAPNVTVKLTNLDPAKLKVFVRDEERPSQPVTDKKSLTFDLILEETKPGGKIPFTLKDDAGKEYKSEVEVTA